MRAFLPLALLISGWLATSAAGAIPPTELGKPVIRAYAMPYGTSTQTWSAAQDRAGNWFFGSQPGVAVFDGTNWLRLQGERYTAVTRAVATAPDGRVYFGSRGDLGWLRPRPAGGFDWVSLWDRLPEADRDFQEVFQILPHGDAVYFAAARKILVWRSEKFTSIPHALCRLHAVGPALYLQSAEAPLERLEPDGRLVPVSSAPGVLADAIRHVMPRPDGKLLAVTLKTGVWEIDPATGAAQPWATEIDDLLRTKQVYRALDLADGSLAVAFAATGQGGLAVIDSAGRFRQYVDAAAGLPSGIVYSLHPDRQGGLWACLDFGIAHLDLPSVASQFDASRGVGRGLLTGFARHDGTLFFGNTAGLFRLVPGVPPQTPARFEREPSISGGVYALLAHDGELFVVGDQRIYERRGDGFVQTIKLPELGYALARSRREPDLLWVGVTSGLRAYRRQAGGEWRDEGAIPGVTETVRALWQPSSAGEVELWTAVNGQGFHRLRWKDASPERPLAERVQVELFGAGTGLPDPLRQVRLGDRDGEPYFMVQSTRGPLRFDGATRKFVPWPGETPLPEGTTVNSVAYARAGPDTWGPVAIRDGQGRGGGGVYRYPSGGAPRLLPRAMFEAIDTPSAFYAEQTPAGRVLWLGGTAGILRLEVDRPEPAPSAYGVQLRSADVRADETLPFVRNAPTFSYIAPRTYGIEPPEYQTRLRGFETEWSAWKPERLRSFTNLSEGSYVFEVRARDSDGVLSQPGTLAFTVLPPWWRTLWAYAGYGAAGLGALLGFARLRTAALRRRNAELEATVQARTLDLADKNRELTRLHRLELDEKITAKLAAEAARLETLRYQLNPHFLLNTLTAVRSQIATGEPQAEGTVERLADFCRLTLGDRSSTELSTVGAEVEILRAYLEIEQTRLGEGLRVHWAIDDSVRDEPMPRSLLLPLVENALKYGLATSEDVLELRLEASRRPDGELVLVVANSGHWVEPGSRPDLPSLGIGHDNLRERLRRHYPDAHRFEIESGEGWVTMRIVIVGRTDEG
ncbi:MAG: histidine kinase [Verrucomicrobia bacterium]|nr:histidine kinase [Verrucomicrobiota bacterium]